MFQAIYISSLLMAFCGSLLGISISLFLAQVRQSGPLIIGLTGFTGSFVYTIVTFALSRHSNRKISAFFIYAPLITGIIYFFIFLSPVPLIFLLLILGGVTTSFFWPFLQKCLSGADELKIGIFNLFWGGGVVLGSFSAGFIYSLGPSVPFFSLLFIYTLAFVPLISQKSKLLSVNNTKHTRQKTEEILPLKTVYDIRMLSFIHFVAMGSVFFLYPKLGLLRGFSPQFIGSVIGIILLSRFIVFSLLIDKPIILHPAKFIISCALFCISCVLVAYGTHPAVIVIAGIILGSTGAVSYYNSLLMHIKYDLKTEIHECIIGAGFFCGSLLAGLLGQILNLPTAYVIIGILILIAGLWNSRYYLLKLKLI